MLGVTDLRGGSWEDNTVGTGYGNHIAQPLLRKAWHPEMSRDEARQLLENCMRVLNYRDARSYNRVSE
jgi:20S proteasome subunit beta 7